MHGLDTIVRSTTHRDDQGEYLDYHRRCQYQDCTTGLTSRNRHQGYLLCKPCARAKDRERISSSRARTPADALAEAVALAKRDDPKRKKAHHLLEQFLNHPSNPDIKTGLMSYLMTIEIAQLMSRIR